jgi:arginine decarboxylase
MLRSAARAWGAEHAFFVPDGSSGRPQALVMAVARPGEEVIVPRNAHKSLLAGLILSGARPVWVEPVVDETWQVAVNVPLEAYAAAIAAHPQARAVFVVGRHRLGIVQVPAQVLAHPVELPLAA